jgi:magnesium transporter
MKREIRKGRTVSDLKNVWPSLPPAEQIREFERLPRAEAQDFFLGLAARGHVQILLALPPGERRLWMRSLAPDDAADCIQEAPVEAREALMELLDEPTRKEVAALLAYAEDDAGGLMNPRFGRVRPDLRVDEAISYLRREVAERVETIYYAYVLDAEQRLLGVVSFRELVTAPPDKTVRDVMRTDVVAVREETDQEEVGRLLAEHDLMAIPVVDLEGRMKGIVSADDIVDVVREEATEDIQKIGGTQALEEPYLQVGLGRLIRKRGGWLSALFLGEMLTASAMGYFEAEIARAVVLALFIPLIISSGGNSGSQATTLVIRAMAIGEVRLRDWWRVMSREVGAGLALGSLLGVIGLARILLWQWAFHLYGEHYLLVALTVAASLVGVVLWGTLAGSMLPFVLRRLGLDPANASAPFVATLVDVSGIVIYFSLASLILRGTLL